MESDTALYRDGNAFFKKRRGREKIRPKTDKNGGETRKKRKGLTRGAGRKLSGDSVSVISWGEEGLS